MRENLIRPAGPGCPRSACASASAHDALRQIKEALGPGNLAQVFLFADALADIESLAREGQVLWPEAEVVGCTTAGEITSRGYDAGQIVAFALPAMGFSTELLVIENLDQLDTKALVSDLLRARQSLARRAFARASEFAVLLVDGLSGQEDALVSALSGGLGPVPLFGGSAGDGIRFQRAELFARGRRFSNAAVLSIVRSACDVQLFSFNHLKPTVSRMVVTRADPEARSVVRINDEPAAREYARLLGLHVEDLSPTVFAANPVLVRVGGRYHARSIQQVGAGDSLVFFAAIDEGLVLTLGEPEDISAHLARELDALSARRQPSAVLGFDCIFRRFEAEGRQSVRAVSDTLARHGVVGFSTYGEQIGAMHVNQTMTGVAFFPPESLDAAS
ncbi:MAG: FIST C-terminal domain-containing protein [Thioclava sp.]|nr:FIST N-terminal domain-containing protein [Thioclava sp.]MBD3802216.1 FIST C-terminal domain-containing protein [Thioclava sp.]